jgi:hypothetical protein
MDRISFELQMSPETMMIENLEKYIEKFGEPSYNDLVSYFKNKEKIENILLKCIENSYRIDDILMNQDIEYDY